MLMRKTYQGSDITQGSPTHIFASPLNEAVMRDHVKN